MAGGKKISDFQKDNVGERFKALGYEYSAPEKEKVEKDSSMDSEAEEKLIFFYHPDHLGSTSYVTDADGNIAQHVEYIPYGEVFVEERNSQFSTNYLFNAKELDNETGLYYYGARYLDPTGAMWLSVDPMWEKYAGMSPYNYCMGNPVVYVDPDGRENTIYLVDLQTEKKIDTQKFIEKVNQVYENFGLKTRMMMAPDGKKFNPEYMDETDSYVAIGDIYDVYNFIKEKSPKEFAKYYTKWGEFGGNPEKSSMEPLKYNEYGSKLEDGAKTSVVGIDLIQTSNMAGRYKSSTLDYAVYLAVHGIGHNATIGHPDYSSNSRFGPYREDNTILMLSGSKMHDLITNGTYKSVNDFLQPSKNSGYIDAIKRHFGNEVSKSNYDFKKKYHSIYFR